ncbi:MAG: hypothetical protein IKS48_11870 [Eubacterium sp.]|nr:hypothetical protein [Eubacterium sp.]
MQKLKKLGVCISLAIASVMTIAPIVHAQPNDSWNLVIKDSYVQKIRTEKKQYSDKKVKELLKKCQVFDANSKYEDDDIRKFGRQFIGNGRNVYDLKSLSDYGLFNVKVSSNTAFNYGILSTDDFQNPSFMTIMCKCSEKDYKNLMKYVGEDYYDDIYFMPAYNTLQIYIEF